MADKTNKKSGWGEARYQAQFHRTTANKARRAARRSRLANKPTFGRGAINRRIRWLTKYAANLRKRISDGQDYKFRLAEIEAELARETL